MKKNILSLLKENRNFVNCPEFKFIILNSNKITLIEIEYQEK